MHLPKRFLLILFILCNLQLIGAGQTFFEKPDSFHKARFWGIASFSTVTYTATVIGLNELWYKDFPKSRFHTFNDWDEWHQIDKMGHAFTAYFETSYVYDFGRWAGLKRNSSLWTSAALGTLFQATVEILDGYSKEWGFSMGDMAFNTAGVGLFVGQELLWQEQRFLLKVSNRFPTYPKQNISNGTESTTIRDRTDELYGTTIPARFLKDYNGLTTWLSMSPRSFFPESKWPKFLNIAIGYGSENLFGARSNAWTIDDVNYSLIAEEYPRYRQWYLSLDIDLRKLNVKKPFWRFILGGLNIFKIPAPVLEWNVGQGVKFRPLYF